MGNTSLNVTVLLRPAETSADRLDDFLSDERPHGIPPKNVIDSYPEKVLNVLIDSSTKEKLINGESVYIDPPDQKADELHELDVNTKGEMILTKYALDKEGQPISRAIRNVKANEVSYVFQVQETAENAKRTSMPWETSDNNSVERKTGLNR